MANNKKVEKQVKYKANKTFKVFVSDKGLLSESQYKNLLKGEAVSLKDVPKKQMNYLLTNNLIIKEQ
tara:strand:+ start:499 stop:699 length:201 start_codon:yes stop_codon:yes gene_type:complete